MDAHSFDGAKLKVKRAYQHIHEIEGIVSAFLTPDAHRIVEEQNPVTRAVEISLKSSQKTPVEINLAFGDAVHNLRASLDYVMGVIVRELAPEVGVRDIDFPIRRERNDLKYSLEKGKISPAMRTPLGQSIANLILDKIEPYGTRDNPFCALNKLDIIDKHRLLLTIVGYAGVIMNYTTAEGGMIRDVAIMDQIGSDSRLAQLGPEFKGHAQSTFQIHIAESELPQLKALVPTLYDLAQVVSNAINAIERCIIAHGAVAP